MAGYSSSTLQIDSGESLSDEAIQLNGANIRDYSKLGTLVAIVMPAAWTAAGLTFQASNDNVTFTDMYDTSGNEIAATVAASRWVPIDPVDFAGVAYLKVRSGTSGTPVNQGADRVLTFITRTV